MRKMILSSADDLSVLAAFVQCRRNTQQGKYPSPYQAVAEGEERRAASSTETEAVPVREGAVAAVAPRDRETRGRGGEDHGCGYSWKWIGLNPNPIGFWLLDLTEFGSGWIWISICFR